MNEKTLKMCNFIKVPNWLKKYQTVYLIFFFLSINFFLLNFDHKYQSRKIIEYKVQTLNTEEKEYVTNFFKYVFFIEPFGYTIFGDKPISFTSINMKQIPFLSEKENYMDLIHIFNRHKLKKCWETWSHYSHLFPMKGFSLISYKLPSHPEFIEVAIINHKNFIKTVSAHLQDFHNILGSNLTPREILDEYIKGEGTIFTTIVNHDGLFGTLLGFGRNNAWEYLKQGGGENMIRLFPVPGEKKDAVKVVKPNCAVIPNTQETALLRKSYEDQQRTINEIYHAKNFLELVLMKLTE